MTQTTNFVALVEPTYFGLSSTGTEDNNFVQDKKQSCVHIAEIKAEFSHLLQVLAHTGVSYLVYESPYKAPDAVFPNNWISVHWETERPMVVIYPMKSPERRKERHSYILVDLLVNSQIPYELIDLTYFEQQQKYLESTGSLVLDRVHRIAYCCLSERSHKEVLEVWRKKLGYRLCVFRAYDVDGVAIYHTNVMMNLGTQLAIICLEAIKDVEERERVKLSLIKQSKKTIVDITLSQLMNFAGNCLPVKDCQGREICVMSQRAYQSFDTEQIRHIEDLCDAGIFTVNYDLIERLGGGSVRCSLLELSPLM